MVVVVVVVLVAAVAVAVAVSVVGAAVVIFVALVVLSVLVVSRINSWPYFRPWSQDRIKYSGRNRETKRKIASKNINQTSTKQCA